METINIAMATARGDALSMFEEVKKFFVTQDWVKESAYPDDIDDSYEVIVLDNVVFHDRISNRIRGEYRDKNGYVPELFPVAWATTNRTDDMVYAVEIRTSNYRDIDIVTVLEFDELTLSPALLYEALRVLLLQARDRLITSLPPRGSEDNEQGKKYTENSYLELGSKNFYEEISCITGKDHSIITEISFLDTTHDIGIEEMNTAIQQHIESVLEILDTRVFKYDESLYKKISINEAYGVA